MKWYGRILLKMTRETGHSIVFKIFEGPKSFSYGELEH